MHGKHTASMPYMNSTVLLLSLSTVFKDESLLLDYVRHIGQTIKPMNAAAKLTELERPQSV